MSEMQITFETFDPLEEALRREWLDANGLGGWASSTVSGTNTRRYHGLLVVSLRPPVERFVLWSRNEEEVECGDSRFEIGTNLYPGAVYPQGFELQRSFSLLPFPTFVFERDGAVIRKHVFVEYGRNTTCVVYENAGDEPFTLRVRPLLAFRDYHSLTARNASVDLMMAGSHGRVSVRPYEGLPPLFFHHNASAVEHSPEWYHRFEYPRERERGLDFREDLFSALVFEFKLKPGEQALLGGTIHEEPLDILDVARREFARRQLLPRYQDPRVNLLAQTARSFVVRRVPQGKTVVAGYHWFADWGRDTMIALPGLALLEGDTRTAREILLEFARHEDGGMIPNRFPDHGESPDYNTVDAALWFVHATWLYFRRSSDAASLREVLFPAVLGVLKGYQEGSRYGIRMDEDGLILAGEPWTQLTWMDAKVGEYVVTPRIGKPVEISALWHHTLRCATELAQALGLDHDYTALADKVKRSFTRKFWNPRANCLFDVLGPSGPDSSIRPNQIFALSLRPELLGAERRKAVFDRVTRDLLTPYGLRSLAPSEPAYHAHYAGDVWSRDTAYHQGTVWGWLIGPYVDAYVHVHGLSDETREEIRRLLEPLLEHLYEAGLGSVSEVFDGEPPHTPGGCVSQAWSVAELLRVYHQYVAGDG
jgi:predicted glycogen debranching enzyme